MKHQISNTAGLLTAPGAALVSGALRRAMNLMVRRQGLYEARRSVEELWTTRPHPWGQGTAGADLAGQMVSLFAYQGYLYGLTSTQISTLGGSLLPKQGATLYRWSPPWPTVGPGAWNTISSGAGGGVGDLCLLGYVRQLGQGPFAVAPFNDYLRTAEINGNIYLTLGRFNSYNADVSTAPMMMDGAVTPFQPGMPRGREILFTSQTTIPANLTAVYPTAGQSAAYRVTWSRVDRNGNVVRGAPSGRFIYAPSTTPAYAILKVWLPQGAVVGWYYEVYRSKVVASGVAPDDELQLVWRSALTAQDVANGYVQFTDLQPDGQKGATLYTSPSQGGIGNENQRPPFCRDMVAFKGVLFYFDVISTFRAQIQVLGIPQRYVLTGGGAGIAQNTPIAGQSTYTFSSLQSLDFSGISAGMILSVKGTASNNGDWTVVSTNIGARTIVVSNAGTTETPAAGAEAVCARLQIVRAGVTANFDASFTAETAGPTGKFTVAFDPSGNSSVALTAASMVRAINQTAFGSTAPIVVTDIATAADAPGNLMFEVNDVGIGFTIQAFGSGSGSGATGNTVFANKFAPDLNTAISAVQDYGRARVMFTRPSGASGSPSGTPEGTNPALSVDVGSASSPGLRAFALRDSIFWFKEDGLWRCQGDGTIGGWQWTLFDPTIRLLSRNLAVVHQGAIYAMTNRGVVRVTDAGREFISSPIDDIVSACQERGAGTGPGPLSFYSWFDITSHATQSEIDGMVHFYISLVAGVNYATSVVTKRRVQLTFCPATNIWTGDAEVTFGVGITNSKFDSSYLAMPGISARLTSFDPGAENKIYRHGINVQVDLSNYGIDVADVFTEAVLDASEPSSWDNRLPFPGDRSFVKCSFYSAGVARFDGAGVLPCNSFAWYNSASVQIDQWGMSGFAIPFQVGDILSSGPDGATSPVFWKVTNVASGNITVVGLYGNATGLVVGTWYKIYRALPVVMGYQPFGVAGGSQSSIGIQSGQQGGFEVKDYSQLGLVLGRGANCTQIGFSFVTDGQPAAQALTSGTTVEPTTRVDPPSDSTRAIRTELTVTHSNTGEYFAIAGLVWDYTVLDAEEASQ
jgi:hypothetical protein